jgi:hypothetical protein
LLSLPEVANGPTMPDDFVGLSYELQQLTDPAFFSSANTGLIAQFRALSSHGVLRLGGNTSEFADWTPRPGAPEPVHPAIRESEGEPKAQFYPVTPKAVENLGDFLRATGWTCLYGINLGTNTPERAADEAAFVARTLGSRLQYFQIGNEVDLFSRHLRDPKTWSVKAYLDEWLKVARAIEAKVPGAKFGMPDVASDVSWLTRIAELWPSVTNPPAVTTLSHHHYFGGPATNPEVNIPNLLSAKAAAKVRQTALQADAAARTMKARVRMTEGNTCYRGGKPGVSDVFAAALWSANYALQLATNNYSGVNLHGGTGKSVANSVGGFLPGDVMLAEEGKTPAEIAAHPHPFYTPIGTFGDRYELEPVAYGLRFAGAFRGERDGVCGDAAGRRTVVHRVEPGCGEGSTADAGLQLGRRKAADGSDDGCFAEQSNGAGDEQRERREGTAVGRCGSSGERDAGDAGGLGDGVAFDISRRRATGKAGQSRMRRPRKNPIDAKE